MLCKTWQLVCSWSVSDRSTDDDHWIIDTDYDNYAIHYSCRELDEDGTCLDGYSFIFSRHPDGLRPEDQKNVTEKKQEICFLGKYRRVSHTGKMVEPQNYCLDSLIRFKCADVFVLFLIMQVSVTLPKGTLHRASEDVIWHVLYF